MGSQAPDFVRADICLPPSFPDEVKQKRGPNSVRTVPELVDFNAAHNADYVFCYQARKDDSSNPSLASITHSEFKDAVLSCQQWLKTTITNLQLPVLQENGVICRSTPVALFMESDIGLFVHIVALLGLGVPALLLSARLSPLAIENLIKTTHSSAILASPRLVRGCEAAVKPGNSGSSPTAVIYERQPYDVFLPQKNRSTASNLEASVCHAHYHADEKDRNAIILHSSGTTGLPKAIYQSQEYVLGYAANHCLSPEEARGVNVSTLPLFHGFGLLAPCLSLSIGLQLCLPANSISSASTIAQLLETMNARSFMTVPSVLDDMCENADNGAALRTLLPLQFVATGGGPLPQAVAEKLVGVGVQLLNHFGATEVGALGSIFVPKGNDYDYRYIRVRQDYRYDIVPLEPSDRQNLASDGTCKLVFYPFGWDSPFEVQDKLLRNPLHPDTDFRVLSRTDDVVVLATGEKVLPGIFEFELGQDPLCKTAVVIGQSQFEVGILAEPRNESLHDPAEIEEFKNHLWEIITRLNEKVDAHARISSPRSIVVVLPREKRIPRSDKGSVLRQETYRVFESEITAMYEALEKGENSTQGYQLDMSCLEAGIRELIQTRLGWKIPGVEWEDEQDLLELGMDSLQALQLRRLLAASLAQLSDVEIQLGRDFVYVNPSVAMLADAIRKRADKASADFGDDSAQIIARLVDKFSHSNLSSNVSPGQQNVVLLTGSTGGLGSHLVQCLTQRHDVLKVICFIRGEKTSPAEKLRQALAFQGLELPKHCWAKIEAVAVDLAKPQFGLSSAEYKSLTSSVTHVVQNGWPMDFNRRVASFESQFRLTRDLIQLTVESGKAQETKKGRPSSPPTYLFVSSIAVVGQYPNQKAGRGSMVPELPMPDNECADEFGYAQAKLVCERIVESAARAHQGELVARYVRVGQMTGARETALWNTREHFPALVKSSQLVGYLPRIRGVSKP
jgi:long-subunit acyl-CoA synthetase (AMP-forming)/nucleoside-diphosphate-sugar epimerase